MTKNTLFQDFANKNEIIKIIQDLHISRNSDKERILCMSGDKSNQLQTDLASTDFFFDLS